MEVMPFNFEVPASGLEFFTPNEKISKEGLIFRTSNQGLLVLNSMQASMVSASLAKKVWTVLGYSTITGIFSLVLGKIFTPNNVVVLAFVTSVGVNITCLGFLMNNSFKHWKEQSCNKNYHKMESHLKKYDLKLPDLSSHKSYLQDFYKKNHDTWSEWELKALLTGVITQ